MEIKFKDKQGTFSVQYPENYSNLYLPIANEVGLKACVTPNLGGDSKIDQNHFLLEPVSIENLHNNRSSRNFWCRVDNKKSWSVNGVSAQQENDKFTANQEESVLEAGFMWQKLTRKSKEFGLKAEVTSFVLVEKNVEITIVEIQNIAKMTKVITPIAGIPIFGRSADNIRDHRQVTSLLHRIHTSKWGVEVTPVLYFDERGHQKNQTTYYVSGCTGEGQKPIMFYPTVSMFLGEGGSYLNPEAVRIDKIGLSEGVNLSGYEAMGAFRFADVSLEPNETQSYVLFTGIEEQKEQIDKLIFAHRTVALAKQAFEQVKEHWIKQVNVTFTTNNSTADQYGKWICFQPILRRIYGCSFLPYHDYGKGGRGWRDLWQDCLALLMMEPSRVRKMIKTNFQGVRMDGTNATIIGTKPGEFIADRNNITRVWMDHAFWPFLTTKLYIDQTGDVEILLDNIPYFKDLQIKRGTARDEQWNEGDGHYQRSLSNDIYFGTILEHLLIQNLCAFYDVGEHNQMRLHGADWNDALDMAIEHGESVAFTCAYAGNIKEIAEYIRKLRTVTGIKRMAIAEELNYLLIRDKALYENKEKKQELLHLFTSKCSHQISGIRIIVDLLELSNNLEEKADWLMKFIRKQEWIQENKSRGWFNGYYDNHKRKVEGASDENVRMMLISQVFAIISHTAEDEQILQICKSANAYLCDEQAGGYRLNTDFKEEKFDLGRMFGFAYGEKENGAVFSHMTVMFAYALYQRGYAREGYHALQMLLDNAMNVENSKMYPGLPEYFDQNKRGLYPYLTGAASWYMLTMITEVFGVKGDMGDLTIKPALMAEQFNEQGYAQIQFYFLQCEFKVRIENPKRIQWGEYKIVKASCEGLELELDLDQKVCITKKMISAWKENRLYRINILLG